jgi:nucleotidyltransferase/DNA polymerase involved in DNA repair
MAILLCAVPDLPLALLLQDNPALATTSLAVLDADERVLAASAPASAAGVRPGQTARQARVTCPAVALRPADPAACQTASDALLALLDGFSPRVEPAGPGRAYLELDDPSLDSRAAQRFCQDVGRRVRQELGTALQPAIGCDSGKFTAQAAAQTTRPGAARVVLGPAEQPFLRPLPVLLLPLPADSQLHLRYLGIRRLGQYADLPPRAVLQQFGSPGRLAQRWARGEDDRPVVPRARAHALIARAAFDPPLEAAPALRRALELMLRRLVAPLNSSFQAAQVLSARLEWAQDGENGGEGGAPPARDERWALAMPTADAGRLAQLIAARWEAGPWAGRAASVALKLSAIQDVIGQTAVLFPELFPELSGGPAQALAGVLARLRLRYGAERLLQAIVEDPRGLRVERRARWQEAG